MTRTCVIPFVCLYRSVLVGWVDPPPYWSTMFRLTFLLAVLIPLTSSVAVAEAPTKPSIDMQVSGTSEPGGQGVATVTGKVKLPPGWTLSIHTLTVRFQDAEGGRTLNAFGAVKGAD